MQGQVSQLVQDIRNFKLTSADFPSAESMPGSHVVDFANFSQSVYRQGNNLYGIDGNTTIPFDQSWTPSAQEVENCYGLGPAGANDCDAALNNLFYGTDADSRDPTSSKYSTFLTNIHLNHSRIHPSLILRILQSFGFQKVHQPYTTSSGKQCEHIFIETPEAMFARIGSSLPVGDKSTEILNGLSLLVDYINQNPVILNPNYEQSNSFSSPPPAGPKIKDPVYELSAVQRPWVTFPGDNWVTGSSDKFKTLGDLTQKIFNPPAQAGGSHFNLLAGGQAGGAVFPITTRNITQRSACSNFWRSAFNDYLFQLRDIDISNQTKQTVLKAIEQLDQCEKQLVQIFQGLSIAGSDRERAVLLEKGVKRGVQLEARVRWLVKCATDITQKATNSAI